MTNKFIFSDFDVKTIVSYGEYGWKLCRPGDDTVLAAYTPSMNHSQTIQSFLFYNEVEFTENEKYGSIIVDPETAGTIYDIILASYNGHIPPDTNSALRSLMFNITLAVCRSKPSRKELENKSSHMVNRPEFEINYDDDWIEVDKTRSIHQYMSILAKVYSLLWQHHDEDEENEFMARKITSPPSLQKNASSLFYDIYQNFIQKYMNHRLLTPIIFDILVAPHGYPFIQAIIDLENTIPLTTTGYHRPTSQFIKTYIQWLTDTHKNYQQYNNIKEMVDSWLIYEVTK